MDVGEDDGVRVQRDRLHDDGAEGPPIGKMAGADDHR